MTTRGTSDRPHLVGYGKGDPVKYQCQTCREWFVEDMSEVCFRDFTRYDGEPSICKPCHEARQKKEWADFSKDCADKWSTYK